MADTRNPKEVIDIGKFKPYDHPQYGPGAIREVEYIDGTIERRFFHHGTEKDGEGAPDSGYLVDTRVNAEQRDRWDRNKPAEPAATRDPNSPANRNEAELQRQRERNAALPPDQDPAYETDADRRKRAQDRIDQQGRDARDAEARARQQRIDEDAAAARNAPKPVATNTTEPYIVQAGPDGKITTTPNPNYQGEKPERSTVKGSDGKTYVVTLGKDGKATAAPVEGLPDPLAGQAEPAGAPPMRLTYGDVSRGLEESSRWYNEQVELYQRTGGKEGMSPEAATKAMERRVKLAEASLREQGGVIDTQSGLLANATTQRGQTLNDTESRRSSAQAIYNNTLTGFLTSAPKAGRGGGKYAGPAMQEVLAGARNYVDSFGGFRESPEIGTGGFPALHDIRNRSLAPAQVPPPMPPNPIAGAALGPVAAGVTATNTAAMAPTGPNIQAATDATMAGTNAAMGALGVPPPGAPINAAPMPPPPMPAPAFTPQPPVNMAPPVEEPTPAAVNPMNDQPITGPFSPPPRDDWRMGGQSFVRQARQGTTGPSPYVQRMIADPSIDNSILAEAWELEYGSPLQV